MSFNVIAVYISSQLYVLEIFQMAWYSNTSLLTLYKWPPDCIPSYRTFDVSFSDISTNLMGELINSLQFMTQEMHAYVVSIPSSAKVTSLDIAIYLSVSI